jgi:membrane associated rhomboid family serine protease
MIVLPLNEEARSGRRTPWVTLAVLLACVASFVAHRGADREVDARTDAAVESAWDYFIAHPYVRVDDATVDLLGADRVEYAREVFRQELAASGSPGIPDFVRQHDQVGFDGQIEQVYAAMEGHSFYRLGFFPETLSAPDASLLTYVLVHEDWLHLVPNVLLILLAGLFLEEVWGRALFAVFVLTGAVAGAVGYATLDPQAGEALGGASGLAAALAGAFLVRFAWVRIRFRYFTIPPFGGTFTTRGWVALPIYGGLYVAVDYLLTHGAPGIEPVGSELATWAHVGGLAWGVVFAALIRVTRVEERFIQPKIEEKLTTQSNPLLDRALEAREAGRTEEAFELLASEVARHPDDRDASLAFWDAATAVGRPEQAVEPLARVLRGEVSSGQRELAVQHWRELTQRVPDYELEAPVEVRITGMLIQAGEHDLAAFSAQRVLDGSCGAVSGATARRLVRLVRDLDAGLALGAVRRALAAPELEPAEAEELERLAAELEGATAGAVEPTEAESGAYAFGDRSDAIEDDPEEDGPDLDGDTLGAEPFELDDLTAPPGVRTLDLGEGEGAADAGGAEVAAASTLPGVSEFPLDDGPSPGADLDAPGADLDAPGADLDAPGADLDAPGADLDASGLDLDLDLDAREPGPAAGDATPAPGDAAAPDLDELDDLDLADAPPLEVEDAPGATRPPFEVEDAPGATAPPLDGGDGSELDLESEPFDAGSLPPLESSPAPAELSADASLERDTTAPELAPGGVDLAASAPDLAQDGLDLSASAPELSSSTPGLEASAPDLSSSTPGLEASAPELAQGGLDLSASAPQLDSSAAGLGTSAPGFERSASDLGRSLPGVDTDDGSGGTLPGADDDDLGASLPGLDDEPPGFASGLDPGASAPDLGLTAPPGMGDGSIPLADESVRTHPPGSLDDTGAPDLGNTIDLSSLGAQTIPSYAADDLPPPAPAPVPEAEAAPSPASAAATRSLKKMEAIPLALDGEALTLDVGERGKAQLALERIDAVSVAGVRGLRPKPVVVIDLVTNWHAGEGQPLKIVRLRSDRFDPAKLMPGEESGFQALKRWIARLIETTGAVPLPDPTSASGQPFRMFDDLAAYEREVLRAL